MKLFELFESTAGDIQGTLQLAMLDKTGKLNHVTWNKIDPSNASFDLLSNGIPELLGKYLGQPDDVVVASTIFSNQIIIHKIIKFIQDTANSKHGIDLKTIQIYQKNGHQCIKKASFFIWNDIKFIITNACEAESKIYHYSIFASK